MIDMELKLMETVDYIKDKIFKLEKEKETEGNPKDIWDEITWAIDLKLECYKDILRYIEKGD